MSISKYKPHLQPEASGFQSNYRKIRWALTKKDGKADFRNRIGRHASSINMLLITFQAKQDLDARRPGSSAIARKLQSEDSKVTEMLKHMSIEQRQCFVVIMQQNQNLLQSVQHLSKMLESQASIPSQIMLQQPVILLDRKSPFPRHFPLP